MDTKIPSEIPSGSFLRSRRNARSSPAIGSTTLGAGLGARVSWNSLDPPFPVPLFCGLISHLQLCATGPVIAKKCIGFVKTTFGACRGVHQYKKLCPCAQEVGRSVRVPWQEEARGGTTSTGHPV